MKFRHASDDCLRGKRCQKKKSKSWEGLFLWWRPFCRLPAHSCWVADDWDEDDNEGEDFSYRRSWQRYQRELLQQLDQHQNHQPDLNDGDTDKYDSDWIQIGPFYFSKYICVYVCSVCFVVFACSAFNCICALGCFVYCESVGLCCVAGPAFGERQFWSTFLFVEGECVRMLVGY